MSTILYKTPPRIYPPADVHTRGNAATMTLPNRAEVAQMSNGTSLAALSLQAACELDFVASRRVPSAPAASKLALALIGQERDDASAATFLVEGRLAEASRVWAKLGAHNPATTKWSVFLADFSPLLDVLKAASVETDAHRLREAIDFCLALHRETLESPAEVELQEYSHAQTDRA